MKEKDKKTLLVGAGAIALLGLAVYASRGSGRDEPLNLGGGGGVAGGGMPAVLAGGVDGTGEGTGQGEVTYNVAFPDVKIPAMPVYTPPVDAGGGGGSYPSLPADTSTMQPGTYQTGGKKVEVSAPFIGAPTTSQPAPDAGGGFGGGGAGGRGGATPGDVSGIPGGSSTKKGANVGADTAPGGLPGLIGGLIGGIGGLFGW